MNAKNSTVKCFRSDFSLAHFTSAIELSVNLMQLTLFYFKLKFSMKKTNGATLAV